MGGAVAELNHSILAKYILQKNLLPPDVEEEENEEGEERKGGFRKAMKEECEEQP